MASKITCLVTLHGIGFEQPPQVVNGMEIANSGYADPLHQHLYKYFSTMFSSPMLSDDPKREKGRNQPGDNGPIYAQSHYRDAQGRSSREEGLKRLGVWCDGKLNIDTTDAPPGCERCQRWVSFPCRARLLES